MIEGHPQSANDFLDLLELETNQLDYIGLLHHWKVYTYLSGDERFYLYVSVAKKYAFNCMYEVQSTKKRQDFNCFFDREYVFEQDSELCQYAVIVNKRYPMSLRGLLYLWASSQPKILERYSSLKMLLVALRVVKLTKRHLQS